MSVTLTWITAALMLSVAMQRETIPVNVWQGTLVMASTVLVMEEPPFGTLYLVSLYVDIDECVEGTADCDANAECINLIPLYYCECNDGYEGNGTVCEGLHYISSLIRGCM